VRLRFQTRHKRSDNHVADWHVVFEEGVLCGFKLVGGSIWRARTAGGDGAEERLYVTLPALPVGGPEERRYFDLLRPAARDRNLVPDFRSRVLAAFRAYRRRLATYESQERIP